MTRQLFLFLDERRIGKLTRSENTLSFKYDESWKSDPRGYAISESLPLEAETLSSSAIDAYLWNLLPDNENILARWAQRFQISGRNAFDFIAAVGEDCAGAVQFIRPERVDRIERTSAAPEIDRLTEDDIADRLRSLRENPAAWRSARDRGQFSLAGAQPKLALYRDDISWAIPYGRTPTTHIIKPQILGLDGHAWNEHICLELAREAGFPAARSRIANFGDQPVIEVERFDRIFDGSRVRRIHQEDFCQALAIHPQRKYQNQGGPGALGILRVLQSISSRSEEDVMTFLGALQFNYLIAGTDAHAKNYALLRSSGRSIRLAPLYDVASWWPYTSSARGVKLAMSIGGEYRISYIHARHWTRLCMEAGLTHIDGVGDRLQTMRNILLDACERLSDTVENETARRIATAIRQRIASCPK